MIDRSLAAVPSLPPRLSAGEAAGRRDNVQLVGRATLASVIAAIALLAAPSSAQEATAHPDRWSTSNSPAALTGPETEARVRDLLAVMTIEEKFGQLGQADIGAIKPEDLAAQPPQNIGGPDYDPRFAFG